MKSPIKFIASLFALLPALAQAQAVPYREISPGAQDVMAEEVEHWQRSDSRLFNPKFQTQMSGYFQLVGVPSRAQRFNRAKLVKCNMTQTPSGLKALRNGCDMKNPYYVPITDGTPAQATPIPAGLYLVGFENSIYPGFITVQVGQMTRLDLQQIAIPGGGSVKIYRDTTRVFEQMKLYLTTYATGESFFKLAQWPFGDLYIKKWGLRGDAANLSYKLCEQERLPEMTLKGQRVCRAWNKGTFMAVMEAFEFRDDGRFKQWEVSHPGKPYAYAFDRLLVSAPTTVEEAQFINVLPGQYTIELTTKKEVKRAPVKLGPTDAQGRLVNSFGVLPTPADLRMDGAAEPTKPTAVDPLADPNAAALAGISSPEDDDGEPIVRDGSCTKARFWRTEWRSFCRSETQEGCNRTSAKLCEPMFDIP